MKVSATLAVSFACLAFAVILYLTSVAGLIFAKATPPGDIGLVATTMIFGLFGILGIWLDRVQQATADDAA